MNSSISSFRRWTWVWCCTTGLLVGGAIVATECLIRFAIEPNDNFIHQLEVFRTARASNVVIGDSHAALGFTGYPGFVNLAYPSETMPIMAGKLRIYFRTRSPGMVILQADPLQLCEHRANRPFAARVQGYEALSNFRMWSPIHRGQWLNYWQVFFTKGFFKSVYDFQPDGSQIVATKISDLPADQQRSVEPPCAPVTGFRESTAIKQYKSVISFLQSRGAKVCLLSFPKTLLWRRMATQHPEWHDAVSHFSEIAHEYGIPHANLSAAFDNEDYFSDHTHLNSVGARELAKMAVKECFIDSVPQL